MKLNNVGGTDRMWRVIVGMLLMTATATGKIGAWGWIGVVPFATGLLKFCPAYSLLGINTCKISPAPQAEEPNDEKGV